MTGIIVADDIYIDLLRLRRETTDSQSPMDCGSPSFMGFPIRNCGPTYRPECACPWQHLHLAGHCLDVHFEEDQSVHVILDGGDWDRDIRFEGITDFEQAKARAVSWGAEQILGC